MTDLADRSGRDVPASAGRLTGAPLRALYAMLAPGWALVGDALVRRYAVADFAAAIALAQAFAVIADADDHHPDLGVGWGRVNVRLSTHDVDGLSERDFIVAAKFNRAFARLQPVTSGSSAT